MSCQSSRHVSRVLPAFLIVLVCLTGCGPLFGNPIGASPQPEDYDQSCAMDSDCAFVYLSESCMCGRAAAVNMSELAEVEADNERETRFEGRCRISVDCAPSIETEPYCAEGTCALRAGDLGEE